MLTRNPHLQEQWINTVVNYIREHYVIAPPVDAIAGPSDEPQEEATAGSDTKPKVDAIVGANTRGVVFALIVASKLQLPYIPIRKAGKIPADPDDVIPATFISREKKVNSVLHFIVKLLFRLVCKFTSAIIVICLCV